VFKDLMQTLRTWLARRPDDARLWELMAAVENRRGNRMGMMRANAEVHLAGGNLDGAAVTLRAARELARSARDADPVELAVIDARLQEVRRLHAHLQPQQNGARQP
jgi:predicted Zn-dependent protease